MLHREVTNQSGVGRIIPRSAQPQRLSIGLRRSWVDRHQHQILVRHQSVDQAPSPLLDRHDDRPARESLPELSCPLVNLFRRAPEPSFLLLPLWSLNHVRVLLVAPIDPCTCYPFHRSLLTVLGARWLRYCAGLIVTL